MIYHQRAHVRAEALVPAVEGELGLVVVLLVILRAGVMCGAA